MGIKRPFLERFADTSILSSQGLPGQPIIEIAGDSRVLVENHRGVKAYGHQQIVIQVPYGCICVSGCQLELARMTKDQLVISGQIQCVQLHRKEQK